jgi:hypothetical protein
LRKAYVSIIYKVNKIINIIPESFCVSWGSPKKKNQWQLLYTHTHTQRDRERERERERGRERQTDRKRDFEYWLSLLKRLRRPIISNV